MKFKLLALVTGVAFALPTFAAETYTADVCIVGGGAGGTVAAVSAVEAGLKTVLIEKNGYTGGAGNFMEGSFAVGSPCSVRKALH